MEEYLAHWGIKGQRWGFRRFQNKDGSLTPAGKERYGSNGESNPRHTASNARKAAKAAEEARKFEEKRQKVLATGNATEVLKYKAHSSQKEMNDALNRIRIEVSLKEISDKEKAKGKSAIDKVIDGADTWRARGEKASNVWNFVVKIHNSFADEEDAWQAIGQPNVNEALEKKKKERAEKAEADEKTRILAKGVVDEDITSAERAVYDKISSGLTSKELKALIEKQRNAKEVERRREVREAENKRAESVRESKIREERAQKLVDHLMKYGSVDKVIANKDIMTPAQFEAALNAAVGREEDKKK